MAKSECRWKCPERWSEWSEWLAAGLHARNRWRLPVLLLGILFASGRRTATTWLRAAAVGDDFQDVEWIVPVLKNAGITVWIVVDGGYAKRPFLRRVLKLSGVVVVGRLRKDAALRQNILRNELSTIGHYWQLPRKIIILAKGLIALAT